MYYRITLDALVQSLANADGIKERLRTLIPILLIINQGQPNEEHSSITVHKCYHDEDPTKPCVQLFTWP